MINHILLLLGIILVADYLFFRKEGFNQRDAISLVLGISWAFLFFTYGSEFLLSIWKNANGADFFLVYFFVSWGGIALSASLPYIHQRNWGKVKRKFLLYFGIGLAYTAIDNLFLGPPAVSSNSPYVGKDLCKLDPTTFSEDVFAGCYFVQKLGIDAFSKTASLIVYAGFSSALLISSIYLIGAKKIKSLLL